MNIADFLFGFVIWKMISGILTLLSYIIAGILHILWWIIKQKYFWILVGISGISGIVLHLMGKV